MFVLLSHLFCFAGTRGFMRNKSLHAVMHVYHMFVVLYDSFLSKVFSEILPYLCIEYSNTADIQTDRARLVKLLLQKYSGILM